MKKNERVNLPWKEDTMPGPMPPMGIDMVEGPATKPVPDYYDEFKKLEAFLVSLGYGSKAIKRILDK